jgi:hypothetical protein
VGGHETSFSNHLMPRNNPEDGIIQLSYGGSEITQRKVSLIYRCGAGGGGGKNVNLLQNSLSSL